MIRSSEQYQRAVELKPKLADVYKQSWRAVRDLRHCEIGELFTLSAHS